MVKHMWNRGFTLLESIFVLFIIGIVITSSPLLFYTRVKKNPTLLSSITSIQLTSLIEHKNICSEISVLINQICFNVGSSTMANTYSIENDDKKIIVQLGFGKHRYE